jgi:glutathione synthase/RimK-type ligase-like ATP-grasp enzyme
MIACLYGRACAPFVEPVVRDLSAAAAAAGGEIQPLTIEAALTDRERRAAVHRLYVLPFDPPPSTEWPAAPAALVRALFPRIDIATSFAVQDLCWDKVATQERLLDRGVPVPETLMSAEPAEVCEFVRAHGFAILKERFSCGGQGHIVMWFEGDQLVGDCGSHQYPLQLVTEGTRRLYGERLVYPGPFYVQRLVADLGPRGVTPGQVLRAYVVDNHVVFWSERYRDRYQRPSDWLINVARGAKYRFVLSVSEEVRKVALRSAEVIGMRIGVVDVIRTGSQGPYVLEVDTDGYHMMIDRQFKEIPEYREFFDLDRYIAEALLVEPEIPRPRTRTEAGEL